MTTDDTSINSNTTMKDLKRLSAHEGRFHVQSDQAPIVCRVRALRAPNRTRVSAISSVVRYATIHLTRSRSAKPVPTGVKKWALNCSARWPFAKALSPRLDRNTAATASISRGFWVPSPATPSATAAVTGPVVQQHRQGREQRRVGGTSPTPLTGRPSTPSPV